MVTGTVTFRSRGHLSHGHMVTWSHGHGDRGTVTWSPSVTGTQLGSRGHGYNESHGHEGTWWGRRCVRTRT
eukprot:13770-Rhodomonas_salina.2